MNTKKINRPVRFGLVGAGTHGVMAVIPAFEMSEGCELVAVADHTQANLKSINSDKYRLYDSLEEMLNKEILDAVYIATLPQSHCELTLTAFENDVHVICEKPLASTTAEAERMVDAAERAGRRLLVMFENRIQPYYVKIKEWIDAGHLGSIEAVHMQSFGKHPAAQPRRTNLLNASGCLDCGIHMLDIVRYWMGGGAWDEIYAFGAWFDEDVVNPPHIAMLARLDSGLLVTFEDSFSYGRQLESVPWNFRKNTLVIMGTDGVIRDREGEDKGFQLFSKSLTETTPFLPSSHIEELSKVLGLFGKQLRGEIGNTDLLASGQDGWEAQRAVEQINSQSRNSRISQKKLIVQEGVFA